MLEIVIKDFKATLITVLSESQNMLIMNEEEKAQQRNRKYKKGKKRSSRTEKYNF